MVVPGCTRPKVFIARESVAQPADCGLRAGYPCSSRADALGHTESFGAQFRSDPVAGVGFSLHCVEGYRPRTLSADEGSAEEGCGFRRGEPVHLRPSEAQAFWDRGEAESFELGGEKQDRLDYYVRGKDEVLRYSRPMGVSMADLTREYRGSPPTAGAIGRA